VAPRLALALSNPSLESMLIVSLLEYGDSVPEQVR